MLGLQSTKLLAGLGEEFLAEIAKAFVERATATVGIGHDHAAIGNVLSECLLLTRGEFWNVMAAELKDGSLEQVLDTCDAGIDDLPIEFDVPLLREKLRQVMNVARGVVPVFAWGVTEFIDDDRDSPLREEEKGEAGVVDLPESLVSAERPGAVWLLSEGGRGGELSGARAVPVVIAEKATAGQSAGPLHRVEVIEVPIVVAARIGANTEVSPKPIDSRLDVAVFFKASTANFAAAKRSLMNIVDRAIGDDKTRDPSAGHAPRAGGI